MELALEDRHRGGFQRSIGGRVLISISPDHASREKTRQNGERLANYAASLASILAFLAVLGWSYGAASLRSLGHDLVPMNPLTAMLFLASSFALVAAARSRGRDRWRTTALTTAAIVAALGALSVAAFLGLDLNLDRLIFRRELPAVTGGTGIPNRMAPNTAFAFSLLGVGIFGGVLRRSGSARTSWHELPAILTASLAFMTLAGYLYKAPALGRLGLFVPMALSTALSFLLLAIGSFGLTPDSGLADLVSSRTSGGRLLRVLIPATVAIPLALGSLRLLLKNRGVLLLETGVAFTSAITVLLLLLTLTLVGHALQRSDNALLAKTAQLEIANERFIELSSTDALTGIANRRGFDERLAREWSHARRSGLPVAIVLIDIDFFKVVNDRWGHAQGDACLVSVARALSGCLPRETDFVARWGGDEFVVLLDGTSLEGGRAVAERLRGAVAAQKLAHPTRDTVTICAGVASAPASVAQRSSALVEAADDALFRAKAGGRDRVEIARESV